MPWLLTTPINVGDLDPNGPYQQVSIQRQVLDKPRRQIRIELVYGNTIDDKWIAGIQPVGKQSNCVIEGSAFAMLVATHLTEDGELTYQASKRALYEHLFAIGIIGPGNVV